MDEQLYAAIDGTPRFAPSVRLFVTGLHHKSHVRRYVCRPSASPAVTPSTDMTAARLQEPLEASDISHFDQRRKLPSFHPPILALKKKCQPRRFRRSASSLSATARRTTTSTRSFRCLLLSIAPCQSHIPDPHALRLPHPRVTSIRRSTNEANCKRVLLRMLWLESHLMHAGRAT